MIKITILAFVILFFGVMVSFLWTLWFPKTRCRAILLNSNERHNVCVRNKSHVGKHMTVSGKMFSHKK